MTDAVRRLYSPHALAWPATKVAPQPIGKQNAEERMRMGEYLDAVLPVPLFQSGSEQREARVTQALDTMTVPERVFIEIDMQSARRAFHSFDYDPLR